MSGEQIRELKEELQEIKKSLAQTVCKADLKETNLAVKELTNAFNEFALKVTESYAKKDDLDKFKDSQSEKWEKNEKDHRWLLVTLIMFLLGLIGAFLR